MIWLTERVRSCVRPMMQRHMTAGPDGFREQAPNRDAASNAFATSGVFCFVGSTGCHLLLWPFCLRRRRTARRLAACAVGVPFVIMAHKVRAILLARAAAASLRGPPQHAGASPSRLGLFEPVARLDGDAELRPSPPHRAERRPGVESAAQNRQRNAACMSGNAASMPASGAGTTWRRLQVVPQCSQSQASALGSSGPSRRISNGTGTSACRSNGHALETPTWLTAASWRDHQVEPVLRHAVVVVHPGRDAGAAGRLPERGQLSLRPGDRQRVVQPVRVRQTEHLGATPGSHRSPRAPAANAGGGDAIDRARWESAGIGIDGSGRRPRLRPAPPSPAWRVARRPRSEVQELDRALVTSLARRT